MRFLTKLLAASGLLLAATAAAQTAPPAPSAALPAWPDYPAYSLGAVIGWGAPYGWGVELGHLVRPRLEANAGLGFTVSGGKIGIGTRYYFTPGRPVSAFVGSNLVFSTGLHNVVITNAYTSINGVPVNTAADELLVNYRPAGLLHLRAGARWQFTRHLAMLAALGYGLVLSGETTDYVSGNYSAANQKLARQLAPGGIEFSYGFALCIR